MLKEPKPLGLLQCPVCGGDGDVCPDPKHDVPVENKDGGFEMLQAFYVRCDKCEMRAPVAIGIEHAIVAWNAMPRDTPWTKEPPVKPGWYWVRNKGRKAARIIHVHEADLHEFTRFHDEVEVIAGPLEEPRCTLEARGYAQ